jgi:hypothetical protein
MVGVLAVVVRPFVDGMKNPRFFAFSKCRIHLSGPAVRKDPGTEVFPGPVLARLGQKASKEVQWKK